MEQEIINFIIERLKAKGKNFLYSHVQKELNHKKEFDKEFWFRFWFKDYEDDKVKDHIFTVLENTPESKLKWYEWTYFDSSMNCKDKEKIKAETPIDTGINEYFRNRQKKDNI
jgi:hypothetical protein